MRIHHVGYLTKDLEKTARAFADLGYTVERPARYDEIRRVNIAFLTNDGYRVELIEPDGPDSPMYPLLKKYRNTPYHFCYITESIEAAAEELRDKGYMVIQEPETAPCIDGRRVCFLTHRHMGIIELVEGD